MQSMLAAGSRLARSLVSPCSTRFRYSTNRDHPSRRRQPITTRGRESTVGSLHSEQDGLVGRSGSGDARQPENRSVGSAGTSELLADADRDGSWMLLVDATPQSHVDLNDPTHLEFEYVRRMGHVLDLAAAPGVPLDVVHLGGGALTLPRYVSVTRPGSRQRVVEIDAPLTELVRERLPLPRGARIRVRADDARAGLAALRDRS